MPQPGGPGLRIYIFQQHGGPVIRPPLGSLFVASYFPSVRTNISPFKVKVKVTLRLAVYSQSVRLGVKPLETHDQTFFSIELLH
jgi:hypothetical protein